ncbi:MAG: MarR family transcriptional regulator, partial [Acidimicrobiia bacterium]|nr:MarR family transcriptional regulator [Acidimicrobiia bacterium]
MGDAHIRTLTRLARLLERGAGDLSLSQFRILALVEDGGERASELADRLALAKPTITAAVDGLVDRGYLTRSADCSDRRATKITITA